MSVALKVPIVRVCNKPESVLSNLLAASTSLRESTEINIYGRD